MSYLANTATGQGSQALARYGATCATSTVDQGIEGFGGRLRGARKAKGLTQRALAEAVGMRIMTVSSWENGRTYRPEISMLRRVAKLLGVSVEWLLVGPGELDDRAQDSAVDPALAEFLASPFGQDVTPDELEALRTRVRFHRPSIKAYHFALLAFREEL